MRAARRDRSFRRSQRRSSVYFIRSSFVSDVQFWLEKGLLAPAPSTTATDGFADDLLALFFGHFAVPHLHDRSDSSNRTGSQA